MSFGDTSCILGIPNTFLEFQIAYFEFGWRFQVFIVNKVFVPIEVEAKENAKKEIKFKFETED